MANSADNDQLASTDLDLLLRIYTADRACCVLIEVLEWIQFHINIFNGGYFC